MCAEVVKQTHELVAEGGRFYKIGPVSWCDTPTDSYRFALNKGWVRDNGDAPPGDGEDKP